MPETTTTVKKKFSGYKMAVLAGLYMFVLGGLASTFAVVYAFLPEHFGVSLTELATGSSIGVFSSLIFGMFAGTVIDKLKPRVCMALGGVLMLAYSLLTAYMQNFYGVLFSFLCIGAMLAFSNQAAITSLLIPWFVEKRASMISTCIATNMFGIFAYQLIAGQIVESLGVQKLFVIIGGATCLIMFVCAALVRNKPEELGESALGSENVAVPAGPVAVGDAPEKKPESKLLLYKNPAFWILLVATALVGSAVSQTTTYMTIYFPSVGGMEYTTAALIVSILGLTSGLCTMVSGKIMEKLGIRKFIILLMVGAVLCNFCTAFYSISPSIVVVLLIGVTYSFGFSAAYITNILVAPLFGEKLAVEANTKLLAVMMGANALLVPTYAKLMESFGYPTVYTIIGCVSVVTLVIYMVAVSMAKKRGVKV